MANQADHHGDQGRSSRRADRFDGYGHNEAFPVQPCANCACNEAGGNQRRNHALVLINARLAENFDGCSHDASCESQHQDDGRQCHAATAGEELAHHPCSNSDQQAGKARHDGAAYAAHCHQQQHRCNGDENVVEGIDEAEILFIGNRHSPHMGDMRPQRGGCLVRNCACCNGIAQVLFAIHWRFSPFSRPNEKEGGLVL